MRAFIGSRKLAAIRAVLRCMVFAMAKFVCREQVRPVDEVRPSTRSRFLCLAFAGHFPK
jgi:hypothetical protein